MKHWLFAIFLCVAAGVADAKGVPFAVKSLEQAETIARQDASKHVLIFFTHEN